MTKEKADKQGGHDGQSSFSNCNQDSYRTVDRKTCKRGGS